MRLRRSLLALLVVLGALLLAACGSDSSSERNASDSSNNSDQSAAGEIPAEPEDGEFRLGTQPWIGYGPYMLAEEQGIFADEGLDVKTTNFKSDKEINAAIASKRLDAINAGVVQGLKFAEAGLPVKIILLEDVSRDADAILARGVTSIEELKGKKVAYEEGTTSDVMLRYALSQAGLTIDDVQGIPIPASDAGTALIAGKVDAASTYEPFVTAAQAESDEVEPLFTAGEKPGLISDALIVREEVLEEKPGQVAAMVRSWQKALDYYNANETEARAAISESLGAKPEELQTAFEGIDFYDIRRNAAEFEDGAIEDTINALAEVMADAGLLAEPIDAEDVIDSSFIDAAARQ